jgi:LuxR family maltose regulon positive regulatory protein
MAFQRGLAYLAEGDLSRAQHEWSDAASKARTTHDFDTYANAAAELGSLARIQGELHRAHEMYGRAHGWLEEQGSSLHLGCLEIGMADILLEWNRLEEARQWIVKGLAHARAGGRSNTQCFGDYVATRLFLALDDLQTAEAAIADATEILSRRVLYPRAWAQIDLGRLALWKRQQKMDNVATWFREQQHEDAYLGGFQHELHNIARARAFVCVGALGDALALLDRLAAVAENGSRKGRLIEVLVLQAVALQASRRRDASLASLWRAIQLAQSEDYMRVFTDEGEPMSRLLTALLDEGQSTDQMEYVKRLLGACTTPPERRA